MKEGTGELGYVRATRGETMLRDAPREGEPRLGDVKTTRVARIGPASPRALAGIAEVKGPFAEDVGVESHHDVRLRKVEDGLEHPPERTLAPLPYVRARQRVVEEDARPSRGGVVQERCEDARRRRLGEDRDAIELLSVRAP